MALKQGRSHRQRLQPVATCTKACSVSKAPADDPWAFLERIDAPQWIDLSVEADLSGSQGDDPWFHSRHKHHCISLAKLNSNATRLRKQPASESNQNNVVPAAKDREKRSTAKDAKDVHRKGQLDKPGIEQCWPRSQIKRIQLQKAQTLKIKDSNKNSTTRAPRFTSSDSSCMSEWEAMEASKSVGFCGERLSISSSVMDSSNETSEHFSSIQQEDMSSGQPRVSCDTPSCSDSLHSSGHNTRNSSGASLYASACKLRISGDLCLSKSPADYLVPKDYRSSVDSTTTTVSGSKSEEQGLGRDKKIWEASSDIRNSDKESEGMSTFGLNACRASKGESITLSKRFQHHFQGLAQRNLNDKSLAVVAQRRGSSPSMSYMDKQMEIKDFQIKCSTEKNFEFEKGFVQQSKCVTKAKIMHAVADCCPSRPKMVDMKIKSRKQDVFKPLVNRIQPKSSTINQISVKGSFGHSVRMTSIRSSQNLKRDSLLKPVLERRKTTGLKQHIPCDLANKKSDCGEQDLVALVAQHNQKIRTLGRNDGKKQGTVLSYR